jgi:condensin complex subunit 3
VISLRKIQEACCYEPVNQKQGRQEEDFEEEDFNNEFVRCTLRMMAVKKSEPAGDRVVRFLGTFLNTASQKDIELLSQDDLDETSVPETPTARLTTKLLNTLLPLLQVKDKTIRFRATQMTSHIINSLDSLDDNLFHQLRLNLLKRIHDKEAPVRLQAVYGLGRLAAEVDDDEQNEDSDSDNESGHGVLVKLLDILQNDPAAEVRRNLLLNLPLTKEVLPYLLERARDLDGATRRALYARLLPALGDFRHLSLTHREKLLRWGLRDRDEKVREATARLFRERWIEDCAALPSDAAAEDEEGVQPQQNNQAADPSLDALLELLERIDIINSGGENGIAQIAMKQFWQGRPDYVDYVSFPDSFWDDLTPELAFVARTFNDFCRTSGKEDGYTGPRALDVLVEEKLPEVTKFGYLLERELNKLIETIREAATEQDEDADEDSVQREFIVEQMLHMAQTFDYSDEVGRRKMFSLMREALALPELPEESTRMVVEVLRLVCGEDAKGEREFCGIVLEAVAEVHDTIMGDEDEEPDSTEESFHSATSHFDGEDGTPQQKKKKSKKASGIDADEDEEEADEDKAIREIMVNMKCLHIAQCMLQNVQCDLEENVHLVTMLNNLVVPAVRSQEAPIRERGLVCLGLCCVLGKVCPMCIRNVVQRSAANVIIELGRRESHIVPALFPQGPSSSANDRDSNHPSLLAEPANEEEENPLIKPILKAYSRSIKSGDPAVQSTGATALSKAMLSRLITEPDLLKQLVVAYFDPDTADNAQLRQSLSYFLPVYCHSRAENSTRMVHIACSVIAKLATIREAFLEEVADAEEEEDGMVKLSAVGNMLLDWTDPRKIFGFAEAAGATGAADGASETHYLFAEMILERLVTSQVSKEEKKVLFSVLGRLHMPVGGCNGERLKTVLELLAEAVDTKVASDATSRNVLTKLQTQLLKQMHDVMTLERGGGGAEETVVDTTELAEGGDETQATAAGAHGDAEATELATELGDTVADGTTAAVDEEDDEEEEDGDVTQLRTEMRDTTLGVGSTTIGAPDAEGTRVGLEDEDDSDSLDDTEPMDTTA